MSGLVLVMLLAATTAVHAQPAARVTGGAQPVLVQDGFQFTEGPATDTDGSVVFSDVRASRIYRWTPDGQVTLWREDTGGANGLFFAPDGSLIICEGERGRITALDRAGTLTVLAAGYAGKRFNRPNDLWVAPDGAVYFSDPNYGRPELSQEGEYVYRISPDRTTLTPVITDLVRPNGLIGTPDGQTLYVTDAGAGQTWRYRITPTGALTDAALFASYGGDGMTIDERGNIYLAADGILVFAPDGQLIERIAIPQRPTNLTFCGPQRRTLFITARTAVYTLAMSVAGASASAPAP